MYNTSIAHVSSATIANVCNATHVLYCSVTVKSTTCSQVSVDSLQIFYLKITSVAKEGAFNFSIKFLVILLWSDFFLCTKPALGAVEVVVHAVHGVVLDLTGDADELVVLLPVKLSIAGLRIALELVPKAALSRVQVVVHPVN